MYGILKETLASGLDGTLRDNTFAVGMYNYLVTYPDKTPVDSDVITWVKPSEKNNIAQRSEIPTGDLRILGMQLKGIRKYPATGHWYGIRFRNKDSEPVSAIFLGSNGVGKSSLYSSLEYGCLGHSYLAEERGYRADKTVKAENGGNGPLSIKTEGDRSQIEYLSNVENISDAEGRIRIHAVNGTKEISLADENRNAIVPPAFFCSDYDIQTISQQGISADYLCTQIGLKHYFDTLSLLKRLNEAYKTNIDDYRMCSEIRDSLKYGVSMLLLAERMAFQDLSAMKNAIRSHFLSTPQEQELNRKHLLLKEANLLSVDIRKILSRIGLDNEGRHVLKNIDSITKDLTVNVSVKECMDRYIVMLQAYSDALDYAIDISNKQPDIYQKTIQKEIISLRKDMRSKAFERGQMNKKWPILGILGHYRSFSELYEFLHKEYHALIQQHIDLINFYVPSLFGDFFAKDIESITAAWNDADLTVAINIKPRGCRQDDNAVKPDNVDPRLFLNTFRFKMFCFLFKFGLACCVKKFRNVNFPYVVDDIFDSSDFDNRSRMGETIQKLVEKHDSASDLAAMPFQLIFFTQDNIIGNSIASEGFEPERVKFSRLFDFRESDKSEIIKKNDERLLEGELRSTEDQLLIVEDLL